MEAFGHICMYLDGTYRLSVKWLEGTSLEEICHIYDTQRVSEIRFVRTKLQHCLLVADNRIWSCCYLGTFRSKFLKCSSQHFLACTEDVFLCRKAHLKVKLIELTRRAVCTCILITEAWCNLEIFVKSGYHQKLFVLLRSLWQRIEFSFVFSGRYDVISCTLRRRSTKNRSLNLQKSHLCHFLSQKADDIRTENHVVAYFCVTKIQISVFQTQILTNFFGSGNVKRKCLVDFS